MKIGLKIIMILSLMLNLKNQKQKVKLLIKKTMALRRSTISKRNGAIKRPLQPLKLPKRIMRLQNHLEIHKRTTTTKLQKESTEKGEII